jgi:hypothetical protein
VKSKQGEEMEFLYLMKVQERVTWVPTEPVQCTHSRGENLGEACMSTVNAILLVY